MALRERGYGLLFVSFGLIMKQIREVETRTENRDFLSNNLRWDIF